jgi:GLPGLI family protein
MLLLVRMSSVAQNYIAIDTIQLNCIYRYTFYQDSTSRYSVKNQEMTLQIGKHCSKFTATHKLYSDSLIQDKTGEPTAEEMQRLASLTGGTIVHSYCSHYIFKNYPVNKNIVFIGYVDKKFVIANEKIDFNWQLVPDSDTILLSYNCKKALTRFAGRDYEAWFTPEIPVSEGPHKFHGLPGLIVKINDLKYQHIFDLVSVQKPNRIIPIIYKKLNYTEITARDYVKALNVKMGQMYNRVQQENGLTFTDDQTKARALNNMKTRNNFIELY